MAEPQGELKEQLNDYVTLGGTFTIGGDVTARENEFLKMAIFGPVPAEIAGRTASGNEGSFAFVSDEGASFGALGSAPLPLQYFLGGIAF